MGKAQLEAQSATSAIAEVALWNIFEICCAVIALRFQFFSVNSAILCIDLNFVQFRSKY